MLWWWCVEHRRFTTHFSFYISPPGGQNPLTRPLYSLRCVIFHSSHWESRKASSMWLRAEAASSNTHTHDNILQEQQRTTSHVTNTTPVPSTPNTHYLQPHYTNRRVSAQIQTEKWTLSFVLTPAIKASDVIEHLLTVHIQDEGAGEGTSLYQILQSADSGETTFIVTQHKHLQLLWEKFPHKEKSGGITEVVLSGLSAQTRSHLEKINIFSLKPEHEEFI